MTDNVELPSGIAVLAEDEPNWSDGPFTVRGVALPEDITPNSANSESLEADERVQTYWPPEVVRDAAPLFEGSKIVDGSEHDPKAVMENPQPSPETIIGEITAAEYEPGTGVLYEGEVDDPGIAKRIDRGRVEVSPTLFRELADDETDDGARPVESVNGVRGLSIVAEGAADGNSIQPATAAMSSMAAEALAERFGAEAMETHDFAVTDVTPEEINNYTDAEWDGSEVVSGLPNPSESEDAPDILDETHILHPSSEEMRDAKSNWKLPFRESADSPVNTRALVAIDAALSGARGGVDGVSSDTKEAAQELVQAFLVDAPGDLFGALDAEESESQHVLFDAVNHVATLHDDGTDGSTSQSSVAGDSQPMTDEDNTLTETERAILSAAEDLDEPITALEEYAAADEPAIVEQDEWEAQQERVDTLEEMMDERLVEDTGLSEATVEAMSFEAKQAEFRDDDGNFDAEVLVQQPETGSPEGDFDDAEVETLIDEVGFDADDRDDLVDTLEERHSQFQSNGWESQAEQAKARLERLGVEV